MVSRLVRYNTFAVVPKRSDNVCPNTHRMNLETQVSVWSIGSRNPDPLEGGSGFALGDFIIVSRLVKTLVLASDRSDNIC